MNNVLIFLKTEDMKKTSALKSVGGNKLMFHTQPNFQGEQHEFQESVAKINEGPWKGKPVKSLVIRGNPWLLYPEECAKVLTSMKLICHSKHPKMFKFLRGSLYS